MVSRGLNDVIIPFLLRIFEIMSVLPQMYGRNAFIVGEGDLREGEHLLDFLIAVAYVFVIVSNIKKHFCKVVNFLLEMYFIN